MLLRSCCLAIILSLSLILQASRGQVREQDDAQSLHSPQSAAESSASIERPEVAQAIIERTNRFRASKDRAKADVNPRLLETAQYFADYMARTDRYGQGKRWQARYLDPEGRERTRAFDRKQDAERGVPATVAWLAEEVGELAQAVRKGNRNQQLHELGDVLAWLASLAHQLDLSLEEAAGRYVTDPPV